LSEEDASSAAKVPTCWHQTYAFYKEKATISSQKVCCRSLPKSARENY